MMPARSTPRCASAKHCCFEGLTPSVGSVGNALDKALAETTIGLYKTECIRAGSPFRTGPIATLADLEQITSAWVHWYNTARLMHRLGRRPPAEAEAEYWASRVSVEQPAPRPRSCSATSWAGAHRRQGQALRVAYGQP